MSSNSKRDFLNLSKKLQGDLFDKSVLTSEAEIHKTEARAKRLDEFRDLIGSKLKLLEDGFEEIKEYIEQALYEANEKPDGILPRSMAEYVECLNFEPMKNKLEGMLEEDQTNLQEQLELMNKFVEEENNKLNQMIASQ